MCNLCFLLPVIVLKITVLGLFKRSDINNKHGVFKNKCMIIIPLGKRNKMNDTNQL